MQKALPKVYCRRSTVCVIEVRLTKSQYMKIGSQAKMKNSNCPGNPMNLETTISGTAVEVTWEKHLGYHRIRTFLIYIWFPRIHLPRVWENCPKAYHNIFVRSIKLLAVPTESEDLSSSHVTFLFFFHIYHPGVFLLTYNTFIISHTHHIEYNTI